jgi:hypothetical protein
VLSNAMREQSPDNLREQKPDKWSSGALTGRWLQQRPSWA